MKAIAKGNDWGRGDDDLCFLMVGEISYDMERENSSDGEQTEDSFMLSKTDFGSFLVISDNDSTYDSDSDGSMPGLQDRTYGNDSSNDDDSVTTDRTSTNLTVMATTLCGNIRMILSLKEATRFTLIILQLEILACLFYWRKTAYLDHHVQTAVEPTGVLHHHLP